MFFLDKKSLQFYENYKKELVGKKIYMGIKDIECSMLNLGFLKASNMEDWELKNKY